MFKRKEKAEAEIKEEKTEKDLAEKEADLKHLTDTISYDMAKRAAESFALVRELTGSEEACKVLSLMEECEPYVNVLILEAVFAVFGFKSGVRNMEFLYDCVEFTEDLFEDFVNEFMRMEEINDIINDVITDEEDLMEYPGLIGRWCECRK